MSIEDLRQPSIRLVRQPFWSQAGSYRLQHGFDGRMRAYELVGGHLIPAGTLRLIFLLFYNRRRYRAGHCNRIQGVVSHRDFRDFGGHRQPLPVCGGSIFSDPDRGRIDCAKPRSDPLCNGRIPIYVFDLPGRSHAVSGSGSVYERDAARN